MNCVTRLRSVPSSGVRSIGNVSLDNVRDAETAWISSLSAR